MDVNVGLWYWESEAKPEAAEWGPYLQQFSRNN